MDFLYMPFNLLRIWFRENSDSHDNERPRGGGYFRLYCSDCRTYDCMTCRK